MVYGRMACLHRRGFNESNFIVGKPGPIKGKREEKWKKIFLKNKYLFFFFIMMVNFVCQLGECFWLRLTFKLVESE